MSRIPPKEIDFLNKLKALINEHMANEHFGVSELAEMAGMSRSNLLRRIKKLTNQSVSQFIREVRLERAMELLKEGNYNVSEVSYQVGFSSASYFVKCFREHYGYPPGEVANQMEDLQEEEVSVTSSPKATSNIKGPLLVVGGILIVLLAVAWFLNPKTSTKSTTLEKSIAVLPFKNDSNDESNVYLINGLMESTLTNLQKIGALKVISRTSVEQYRSSPKSIPEIAEELDVNYFVEGSGQKIGDRIMLNIQLVEASSDQQLWSAQYERDTKDIFKLQQEIASNIANEIKAIITPTERKQITKIPTDNLLAYDNYLKGQNSLEFGSKESLLKAIPYFKNAIELDKTFSQAYAALAVSYYYLDLFQSVEHAEELQENAAKAMELDSDSPDSNIAAALALKQSGEYEASVPYLERALELNPNSAEVINLLSDLYANYLPDSEKYLEYALMGVQLSKVANDSLTTSYIYLHLSNALIQAGFVEEAIYYVDRSLEYNADNGFSNYVKAFMLFGREGDYNNLRDRLITEWQKDSSRLDILQEIGKIAYFMEDYETAYHYYELLLDAKEARNLDILRYENLKIGVVYKHMGEEEKGEALIEDYYAYAQRDNSYYRHIYLSVYYAYKAEADKAIEHLREFSKHDTFHYWFVLFDQDPTDDPLADNDEYNALWKEIRDKFWRKHERLKTDLKEKGLI